MYNWKARIIANSGKARVDELATTSNVEFAQVTSAFISDVAATAIRTNITLTDASAGETPVMGTTSPIAGAPTKWIAINDNGTARYIPTWSA